MKRRRHLAGFVRSLPSLKERFLMASQSQRSAASGSLHRGCTRLLLLSALAAGLYAGLGLSVSSASAATSMVNLGEASTYAVISGASVGNTVNAPGAPHTTLRGDLGVKANTQPTGFPPGIVTGSINVGTAADQAHADLVAAYTEVAARTGGTPLPGGMGGATVTPGLYAVSGAASNTGTLTLDGQGNPNSVFVFQVNGALAFAAGSQVKLVNGAKASRVFWQVNGAGSVGAGGKFAGTLMAMDAVAMGAGTQVNGRAFARNGALTLDSNEFYSSPPSVTIDQGATAYTTDTTPTISGTTDDEAPGLVTVTIAGQTLTAVPSGGAWSVTSAILANGTYPVTASVSDAAGNTGTAAQQLTVDTVLPVITLDGSPAVTNDPTPTISGTTDVAVDTVVHVTVDSQSLRALVQIGGVWNIRPAMLADGDHAISASVMDPAGNQGTDSGVLAVDTLAPTLTVTGGASALTNDATPRIQGTSSATVGTVVTVALADETLPAPVGSGGGWSAVAGALSNGPHRVVVTVSDAAGNSASFTQTLTVDTVSPLVAIAGGASAASGDLDPTITGSSNAAPGTTINVSIAGQTLTTLLQPNGTWNATPGFVGPGTWTVVATASDPAGNVGSASQTLTISTVPRPPVVQPDPIVPPDGADTKDPQTLITKAAPRRSRKTSATFGFSSNEAGSKYECKFDAKPYRPCTSPVHVRVKFGKHTFKVRAIDRAGNVDPTPASAPYRVIRPQNKRS